MLLLGIRGTMSLSRASHFAARMTVLGKRQVGTSVALFCTNMERSTLFTPSRIVSMRLMSSSSPSTPSVDATSELIDYYSVETNKAIEFGQYQTIISPSEAVDKKYSKSFSNIKHIGSDSTSGQQVWIRGRVNSVRGLLKFA